MKRILLALVFLAAFAGMASAQLGLVSDQTAKPAIFKVYAGANGLWYQDKQFPSDFELGGFGRASLSPHLSGVASLLYGVDNSYVRSSIGGRITATDVTNPDFSVGFGLEYQSSSEPKIRPEEWASTVSIGWRPWAASMPKLVLGAQGQYGFKTNAATALLAMRYLLTSF